MSTYISGGLANYGRCDGDVSIGRQDNGVGDSVEFQDDRWDLVSSTCSVLNAL